MDMGNTQTHDEVVRDVEEMQHLIKRVNNVVDQTTRDAVGRDGYIEEGVEVTVTVEAEDVAGGDGVDHGQEPGDSVLSEAEEAVLEGRVDLYGEATDNWTTIAALWSEYLGVEIEPSQAADMMVLVKLGRKATGTPQTDHNRDVAGYALIAEMLEAGR